MKMSNRTVTVLKSIAAKKPAAKIVKPLCGDTIKAVRMAHALVKKGKHDNYRIQQIVRGKVGVHVSCDAIAGLQRSHRYQVGKAMSLVM